MKKGISILLVACLFAMFCTVAAAEGLLTCVSTPLKGSSDARLHNVELAAERINGMYMATDMVFTFNGLVGPRTKEAGFKTAPNGRGAKVVGGGVAQVASTIYLALKEIDDIKILEKHTYGSNFVGKYVDSDDDAIMTDYKAEKDFRFKNTGRPFMIYLWFENNELFCQLETTGDEEAPEGGDEGAAMYSGYANLSSFDPDTGIAYFDSFDMLQGADAVEYLVNWEGYSKEDAEDAVSDFADSEFIMFDPDATLRPVDINGVMLLLMYQPSGEPIDGVEGVPSNAGDFYALYAHDSSLLLDSYFYYIHTDADGNVNLVEQMYWP
ncbi:MAG: VanW family protein [Christensenellales bacterium]|jgi:hypothetical protein